MNPPRIRFLIGGVQKGGTTALASYLSRHPALRLPPSKEAHVFDAPDFDEAWSAAEIDTRHAADFPAGAMDAVHGDATPINILHSRLIERVARYNPAMRWIVLLRDPVERAVSHYHMEHARGDEQWPLWPALLLERWRLRGHADNFNDRSPLRHHSYRLRGDYARQLDALYARFPPSQVLLMTSGALRGDPASCVEQACRFLDVEPLPPGDAYLPVFEGKYPRLAPGSLPWRALRWLLRHELRALHDRYGISFDDLENGTATGSATTRASRRRA